MKNRLYFILFLVPVTLLLFRCGGGGCVIDLSAIQYDQSLSLYPAIELPLNVEIENPSGCFTDYFWSSTAGRIDPDNGTLSPTLITDCDAKSYSITLDVKDQNGKIIKSRSLEISTSNLESVDVATEYTSSGYFGDASKVKFEKVNYQGKEAEKFDFDPNGNQGFAGVYYQYPSDNWGDYPGKDLSGYNKVRFEACSPDAAVVNFIAGGVADGTKEYKDSFKGVTGFKNLTSEWQSFEINLKKRDLSSVLGGFAWVANRDYNAASVEFYIANIEYIRENCN